MFAEMNKAIVRCYYEEVFNKRNVDMIDKLVADKFINNDPTSVASRDRASMKQFIKTLTMAFPDHHHAIEDLIAEGDKVVMRCTLTATHKGIFPGFLEIPPTGKTIYQKQIHILRVREGKITEHWVVRDDLAMLQQLGVIPLRNVAANF
ncbi:MAG: ester cyclase [Cyanobacteria bacterium CRU_2_1]|nr:ester cyclase [Cyanobacteria bacterium CRU_2_1]